MKYKIYDGLSAYLIAPDGTAINKDTAEVVPFEKTPLMAGYTAKLITDETHTVLKGKRQPIRLVRRHTREELLKMYARAKNEFVDSLGEIPFTNEIQKMAEKTKLEPEDVLKARTLILSPHQKDLAIASMDHGEFNDSSIPAGHFREEAGQITQEQMDQLSASKRTVKRNPKTPKALIKKVQKAIKETKSKDPLEMKIPFFRINGVEYQSARKASEALGVSVNTVLKRAKANKDDWFYIEKA